MRVAATGQAEDKASLAANMADRCVGCALGGGGGQAGAVARRAGRLLICSLHLKIVRAALVQGAHGAAAQLPDARCTLLPRRFKRGGRGWKNPLKASAELPNAHARDELKSADQARGGLGASLQNSGPFQSAAAARGLSPILTRAHTLFPPTRTRRHAGALCAPSPT